MEKCKIILADTDLSYLSTIELLLLREYGSQADLQLITDAEYLAAYFAEPRKTDILVINEDLWQEDFRRQDIRQVFLLSEDEHPRIHTEDNDILLYKYTSARDVFASLNIVLRRLAGTRTQTPTRVVMVYSPQGGSGKTTIAMGICCGLVNIGSRVLYVNTESLQSFGGYLPEERAMDDGLIKQLLSGEVQPAQLQANILHKEFDYLAPMQYAMTSYGMDETRFSAMLRTAAQSLGYDFMVLDCSCDFTAAKAAWMKSAAFVVLPFRADPAGLNKFLRLRQCINTNDTEKFIFVQTPSGIAPPEAAAGEGFPPSLSIPTIQSLQDDAGTEFYKIQASNAFAELIYRFL